MDEESKKELHDRPAQKRQVSGTFSKAKAMAQHMKTQTTHEVQSGETLSHLALKYYGHATKPYWTLIYEANKVAIGDNPNKVRVGTTLKIPTLPEDMA